MARGREVVVAVLVVSLRPEPYNETYDPGATGAGLAPAAPTAPFGVIVGTSRDVTSKSTLCPAAWPPNSCPPGFGPHTASAPAMPFESVTLSGFLIWPPPKLTLNVTGVLATGTPNWSMSRNATSPSAVSWPTEQSSPEPSSGMMLVATPSPTR